MTAIYEIDGLLDAPRPLNRAMAESLYSWESPRWPHPTDHVHYCEFHYSPMWLDLCWWNGGAWQYVTTRPFSHDN